METVARWCTVLGMKAYHYDTESRSITWPAPTLFGVLMKTQLLKKDWFLEELSWEKQRTRVNIMKQ